MLLQCYKLNLKKPIMGRRARSWAQSMHFMLSFSCSTICFLVCVSLNSWRGNHSNFFQWNLFDCGLCISLRSPFDNYASTSLSRTHAWLQRQQKKLTILEGICRRRNWKIPSIFSFACTMHSCVFFVSSHSCIALSSLSLTLNYDHLDISCCALCNACGQKQVGGCNWASEKSLGLNNKFFLEGTTLVSLGHTQIQLKFHLFLSKIRKSPAARSFLLSIKFKCNIVAA